MLNPEIAQAQLKEIRNPNSRSQRVQRVAALPDSLREIGYGLTNCGSSEKEQKKREKALAQLADCSDVDLTQLFDCIFPKFSSIVTAAWNLFTRLPYQTGYCRKAFRAPNHPEYQQSRSRWLLILIESTEGYDHQELEWFAAWVPYLNYYSKDGFGILFAAAIEQGNDTIYQILVDSAQGDHDIGAMGRHVTRALLVSNRVEGWEFIERLLLAAQRQEGLRQVILETIDEAHPIAFERILRLIVQENLTRFSAVIRAIDVWFGFALESQSEKVAKHLLTQISDLLSNPSEALKSDDPQTVYFGLWCAGFRDAIAAIDLAIPLLNHAEPNHRFVAVHFLKQLDLTPAKFALLQVLDDSDLRVSAAAIEAFHYCTNETFKTSDLFERLEQILLQFPEKPKTIATVWEWAQVTASQESVVTALINHLGTRSPKRLIPFLSAMDTYQRQNLCTLLAAVKSWDEDIRSTLFRLVGDSAQWVRENAIRSLQKCTITDSECLQIEQFLTRKASDLRRGVLGLLLNQADESAITSADRLLQAKQAPQRQAGLELLRELVLSKRLVEESRNLATNYQTQRSKRSTTEDQLLTAIIEPETKAATLTDALGLIDRAELTPIVIPKSASVAFQTPAAIACLESLDQLIHDHRQTPIKLKTWQGEEEYLLGNVGWQIYHYSQDSEFPLEDVWENWWQQRTPRLRDEDELELFRAISPTFPEYFRGNYELSGRSQATLQFKAQIDEVSNLTLNLKYPQLIHSVMRWLIKQHRPEKASEFCLNAIADLINLVPMELLQNGEDWEKAEWAILKGRISELPEQWVRFARSFEFLIPEAEQSSYRQRWWHLVRWIDTHIPNYRALTSLRDVWTVYQLGIAKEADLIFYLLGAEEKDLSQIEATPGSLAQAKANLRTDFSDLSNLTRRKLQGHYETMSELAELVDRIRQRILMIELQRGDFPTAASAAANCLSSITGMTVVIQLIQGLGQEKLVRGYSASHLSKSSVFSHLMRVSFPAPEDTPEEFKQRVLSAKISEAKLIQFAFYAPQWVNYVEHALGWAGFTDAVWWIHAHTKDVSWSVGRDVRETWEAQISERTPLSSQSLVDGAVDVAWFLAVRKRLKPEQWQKLYDLAQFASSGGGHQRARLFADAMLGNLDSVEIRDRITQKRHQDSVRALGLLPLPKGKKREKELLDRYQFLQEFLRTSKKFGSQRQASEKLAIEIGLANLARTAGYVDPLRLQWAMEAAAVADLAEGKVQTVEIDTVSVSLSINPLGEPEIAISKASKSLKSIPAKLKKDSRIQAITNRKQDITKQASRMRISLEQAMCRSDRFTVDELMQLRQHPVLAPMLNQLVLVSDSDLGYLEPHGLRHHDGTIRPIQATELRIAHPADLLHSNEWHLWQQDCFAQSRTQPFKQIFRELYVLTAAEQTEKISRRYEGHQVTPQQAMALFGQRGWIASRDEGVRRTFHAEGLIAEVEFMYGGYTPLEVEGLTIAGLQFYRRDEWKALPLTEIPPALLSEVMRDMDLVVSVAHQGGVDPEATASTVEMRSSLVRETCRLLKLPNVHIQGSHALIEGHLGTYSIHLGSAIVHRQPGGALCIIPVPSQHRGRIFLPFVDNDPKTAEVISKVVLLAKDKEIQDPTILEQIL